MAVIEIARVDASLSTFLLVHSYLAMLTVSLLVSVHDGLVVTLAPAQAEAACCILPRTPPLAVGRATATSRAHTCPRQLRHQTLLC